MEYKKMNGEDILFVLIIIAEIGIASFLIVVIAGLIFGFAKFGIC